MFDAAKATRWMKRERKALDDYIVTQDARGFPKFHRDNLEGFVSGKQPAGAAITALWYLAGWLGANGCRRVFAGEDSGFADLDLSCVYAYWTIRLLARGYDADTRPEKQPRAIMENVATCWMHAEAIGADEVRDWLSDRIRLVDAGNASIDGKDMNELCTLMAHFVTGKGPKDLKASGWAPLGSYERVVLGLASADYDELAVYHTNSVDDEDDGYPPFHFYPYRLAPFELIAIEKRTGVPIAASKHPVLDSSLAKRRASTTPMLPAELMPVIDRMRTMFEV
jgi:hypothetical protein